MSKKKPDEPRPPPVWIPPELGSRNVDVVAGIFAEPTRADVTWRSLKQLVTALGGTIQNGRGSRRRIKIGTRRANLHEPHPGPNMAKGAVEDVREFLKGLGIKP
jgi:hypothetical protein